MHARILSVVVFFRELSTVATRRVLLYTVAWARILTKLKYQLTHVCIFYIPVLESSMFSAVLEDVTRLDSARCRCISMYLVSD